MWKLICFVGVLILGSCSVPMEPEVEQERKVIPPVSQVAVCPDQRLIGTWNKTYLQGGVEYSFSHIFTDDNQYTYSNADLTNGIILPGSPVIDKYEWKVEGNKFLTKFWNHPAARWEMAIYAVNGTNLIIDGIKYTKQ